MHDDAEVLKESTLHSDAPRRLAHNLARDGVLLEAVIKLIPSEGICLRIGQSYGLGMVDELWRIQDDILAPHLPSKEGGRCECARRVV